MPISSVNYDEVVVSLQSTYDAAVGERSRSKMAGWKRVERKRFLDALQAAGCRSLIELGAGHGRDSLFFARKGLEVTSIDLSAGMAAACRRKGLTAFQMNLLDLTFPDASFDAVFSMNALLHVPDEKLPIAFSQIRRILKPDGLFYYGTYGGERFEGVWEEDHNNPRRFFNYYSDQELITLVDKFFELKYFRQVDVGERKSFHFQSLILARPV
mgnify:CR=1 FL=1